MDGLISLYETRCQEFKDDPDKLHEYMMKSMPYIKEFYELNEQTIKDENFPLVFRKNTKGQELFERFMIEVEGKPAPFMRNTDTYDCKECGEELIETTHSTVCPVCGLETRIMGEGQLTYRDEQEIEKVIVYSYKRENHFNEWISQFQGTECTNIPLEILENLKYEFKKQKIQDLSDITHIKVRAILKKLRLNKYYEHVPYITTIINGITPPRMSHALEARLRLMFKEIQEPFEKCCPKERKNFLSYSYVLYKFCELVGQDEFLPCFPLLKSKEKLKQQDIIWKKICTILQWEYIPTI